MTTATLAQDAPAASPSARRARPPLVTRGLLLRFVSIIGSSVSFYLPLSVMPMFARASGASTGAGLVTGVLLLTTVLVELITPRLLARVGYRMSLTVGLFLLGAPALALLVSPASVVVIGVSIARGAGFAVTTVAGGALTAAMIPRERRGEGLGLVGIVGGIPALVALPAGVWVAVHWGFQPVFVVTAAAALLGLTVVPGYPGLAARPGRPQAQGAPGPGLRARASRARDAGAPGSQGQDARALRARDAGAPGSQGQDARALRARDAGGHGSQGQDARGQDARGQSSPGHGVLGGLHNPGLLRPAGVFSASTLAAGVLVTFLPLAVAGRAAWVTTAALFAQPAASTVARWAAGRVGDRRGHAGLLIPGVVLSAVGLVALAGVASPVLVISGATAFGIGFGLLQNASLTLMYARVPADGQTAVSAIWNAAYDTGMGVGAIGMGLVAGHIGYPGVFLLTGLLTLTALLPAARERATARGSAPASARTRAPASARARAPASARARAQANATADAGAGTKVSVRASAGASAQVNATASEPAGVPVSADVVCALAAGDGPAAA